MTKTLGQFLDEVAISYGYNDYAHAWSKRLRMNGDVSGIIREAALLYGESKFEEGKQYVIGLTEHQTNL